MINSDTYLFTNKNKIYQNELKKQKQENKEFRIYNIQMTENEIFY